MTMEYKDGLVVFRYQDLLESLSILKFIADKKWCLVDCDQSLGLIIAKETA